MKYTYISSRQNPTLQSIAKLKDKKYRDAMGLYTAEGKKLCAEAVGNCIVKYALLSEKIKDEPGVVELCEKSGGEIMVLSESAFAKLSTDTDPDGILFVCETDKNNGPISEDEHIFALEEVRDPGNVGTVIRTAAAFGFDRLILAGCADIYNPKAVRASMGAVFKMKFTVCSSLTEVIPVLRAGGRRVIASALRPGAMMAGEAVLKSGDCLVLGNEGHGVSAATLESSDDVIYIPMTDKTESLNAAAAAAVLLWEYAKSAHSISGDGREK